MTQYIDPNSGAAPQPGGMVVGGAESQRGAVAEELSKAQEETLAATQEKYLEGEVTSDQEAELHRQIEVTQNQAEADGGEPAAAETPELAATTNETPGESGGTVDDSLTKDELVEIAKQEEVEGYSSMNKPDLIKAINDKRQG